MLQRSDHVRKLDRRRLANCLANRALRDRKVEAKSKAARRRRPGGDQLVSCSSWLLESKIDGLILKYIDRETSPAGRRSARDMSWKKFVGRLIAHAVDEVLKK
jgi:hypothetical protein